MVDFVRYGEITAEGARVIAYMKAQLKEAEAAGGVEAINALSGAIKHFYANCLQLKSFSEAEWLTSYGNSAGAMFVYLTEAEAQQEAAAKEAAERTRISESLDEVKAALAVALARIAELETAEKPADEPKADEVETEAEAEQAAPVEAKAAKKAAKTEEESEA